MKSIDEKISKLEKQLRDAKAEKELIESENPGTIEARVCKVMKLKGVMQKELAKELSVLPSAISHILSGRRKLSAERIGKAAWFLGVSCDYLILGKMDGGGK
ncbi:MAG: helix-turn-helix transcriptional regulator [Ruminococcus sp.]|nr:helix-turn-helix transcriptional regulator [Ruminococcus sp.]